MISTKLEQVKFIDDDLLYLTINYNIVNILKQRVNIYIYKNTYEECFIFDVGFGLGEDTYYIIDTLRKLNCSRINILITHTHVDHYCGIHNLLSELERVYELNKVQVYIHRKTIDAIEILKVSSDFKLRLYFNHCLKLPRKFKFIDELKVDSIKIFDCPGHCVDHVCFELKSKYLLTGDNILRSSPYVGPPLGDLRLYLQTLIALKDYLETNKDIIYVLPAHEEPIPRNEAIKIIQKIFTIKVFKLKKVYEILCSENSLTIDELTKKLYENQFTSVFDYNLKVNSVKEYVKTLRNMNLVELIVNDQGVLKVQAKRCVK